MTRIGTYRLVPGGVAEWVPGDEERYRIELYERLEQISREAQACHRRGEDPSTLREECRQLEAEAERLLSERSDDPDVADATQMLKIALKYARRYTAPPRNSGFVPLTRAVIRPQRSDRPRARQQRSRRVASTTAHGPPGFSEPGDTNLTQKQREVA
jgi:hypothetical protein